MINRLFYRYVSAATYVRIRIIYFLAIRNQPAGQVPGPYGVFIKDSSRIGTECTVLYFFFGIDFLAISPIRTWGYLRVDIPTSY